MRTLVMSALVLSLAACSMSSEPEVAPDGTVDVPNEETGLRAKIPENAKPNGFGGAAGFHSDDKAISVMIRESDGADMASAKASAEEMLFKEWISAEETEGGYVLQYKSVGMDMEGNEYDNHVYKVVRTIGDKAWSCSGSVKDQANLAANVEICNSLKM